MSKGFLCMGRELISLTLRKCEYSEFSEDADCSKHLLLKLYFMTKIANRIVASLSLILFLSCDQKPASVPATEKAETIAPVAVSTLDSRLFLLYALLDTPNYKQNPFYKMIHSPDIGTLGKVVFQFYVNKNHQLTLVAYAGEAGHKKFNKNLSVILDTVYINDPAIIYPDLNTDICLADLEVFRKDNHLKDLKDMVNDLKRKYLIWVPKMEADDEMSNRSFLEYKIIQDSVLPKNKSDYDHIISHAFGADSVSLTGGSVPANPSPPRGGN